MFNETFWFFYLVEICDRLGGGGAVLLVILGIIVSLASLVCYSDEDINTLAPFYTGLAVLSLGLMFGAFMPPKEAFYGGATQYVGESIEADKTLLRLKEFVDKKIEDQFNESTDTETTE